MSDNLISTRTEKIGFVGLGAMGLPMAVHLVADGYALKGFDLNVDALAALQASGGDAVASASDAARDCNVFIVMVVTSEQAEAVLFGRGDAARALKPGAIVWLAATVPPHYSADLARRLSAFGVSLVDGPVSGGVQGARNREMTLMLAGPPKAVSEVTRLGKSLAKTVFELGTEPGAASTAKAINQLLTAANIALTGEALAMARSAGLDTKLLYDLIVNSAGNSRQFELKAPRMLDANDERRSSFGIFRKDMDIVTQTAASIGLDLPVGQAVADLFATICDSGRAGESETRMLDYLLETQDLKRT